MSREIEPKPAHLAPRYGAQFGDASIVHAYRHRPPYPDELFDILAGLLPGGASVVLDAGCGNGDLTLGLLRLPGVTSVDAIDLSPAMIAAGRNRPGGDDPRLRWIAAPLESVELAPPYGLITAGESLHWMDWPVVLPRLRDALAPGAVLAIAGRDQRPSPWSADLLTIVQRHSTNTDFRPYNLIEELRSRGLLALLGSAETAPILFQQSIDDYIESWHSRNGLSRDRMTPAAASAFDRETRALLAAHGATDRVELQIAGHVTWGSPAQRQD